VKGSGAIFKGVKKWILASAAVFFVFMEIPLGAAEVYSFVDGAGVVHFSNVPTDQRYRPFSPGTAPVQSRASLLSTLNRIAREQGVDPALVRAVIKAESDFNPDAISQLGAQGLMQLMPLTSINLSVQNPFDPEENISGGVRYLKYLLNLFHQDFSLALAAYHAGENLVLKVGGIPPIESTQQYVQRVLKFYRRYRAAAAPPRRTVGIHGEPLLTNRPERPAEPSIQRIRMD